MGRVLACIPSTSPCADDAKVQGSTEERYDTYLLETFQKAHEAGLKFNPDYCCIKTQQIEYFGQIIAPAGVSPCPKKVSSIAKFPEPVEKYQLQIWCDLLISLQRLYKISAKRLEKTHLMGSMLKRESEMFILY